MEKAAFGAGCFWHVEEEFAKLPGVKTTVGFMGGKVKNVSYNQVCSGNTGHAEVVLVEYDEKKIDYSDLLDVFWKIHNPTQADGQGPDRGDQYRSVIFYYTEKQKGLAEKSLRAQEKNFPAPIVTQIVKASDFWKAEDYHQKYFQKHKTTVSVMKGIDWVTKKL